MRSSLPALRSLITVASMLFLVAGCTDGVVHIPVPVNTDLGAGNGGDGGDGDGGNGNGNDFAVDVDLAPAVLDVEPSSLQTLTVSAGQSMPTVTYTAYLGGQMISAAWSIDRGDIGSVGGGPSATTTFAPKGTTAGLVTLSAGINGMIVKRQIQVNLTAQQNGPSTAQQGQVATSTGQLTQGGGVGGVGGEGLGGAVTDTPTLNALGNPSSNGQAQGLTFLYPYDGTVFPRGILAPLLMWSWSTNDADAILVELKTTSGSFDWKGTFGRPPILSTTNGPFVRMPIPQDVWTMATNSAGAPTANGPDKLIVSLTVAKGGVAYGPITETWGVAAGRLSGIIYYNSYGTQLAKNYYDTHIAGDHMIGGAVLSIHVGDTSPQLVAGSSSTPGTTDNTKCRVCHSVAAFGSRLVVQHGDNYSASSAYDLTPAGATENLMSTSSSEFPGLYPDGSHALQENGQLLTLPTGAPSTALTGLSTVAGDVGTPAFSPDGKLLAFNPMSGVLSNPTQKLVVMSFDATTNTVSNAVVVSDDTGQSTDVRPGWPAFLPDGKSIVFHHQSVAGSDGNSGALWTRKGALAQIAWTSASDAAHVTALDKLNGKGYLPKLAQKYNLTCTADGVSVGGIDADHSDDVDHNYEPTVNPVPSGGYVWVVFTSRRMYGNEAVIPPFCSDPRGVDLVDNITPKKLWVAAIDLNAQPGSDASHPAFYLPGQELLAGNSRGFWVLDPCRADGSSCDTGDQCCNGYCEAGGDGGSLICTNTPPNAMCSQVGEKCTATVPCCDSTNLCENGFCSSQIL